MTVHPDPIDAVLSGDHGDELSDVATLVDELVTAYVPADDPARSAALTRFTENGAPPAAVADRRWNKAAAAIIGTVAGKVLLGGAVAVASVGGLHAADAVDVPFLPDQEVQDEEPADQPEPQSEPAASEPSTRPPTGEGETTSSSAPSTAAEPDVPDTSAPATEDLVDVPADESIPAPTTPTTTVVETPPILDQDIWLPGPDLPELPDLPG